MNRGFYKLDSYTLICFMISEFAKRCKKVLESNVILKKLEKTVKAKSRINVASILYRYI